MSGGCGGHGGGPTLPRRRASGQTVQYQQQPYPMNSVGNVIAAVVAYIAFALLLGMALVLVIAVVLSLAGIA